MARQGDIYWAELPVKEMGRSIQCFRRPYLIVSCDDANNSSSNITVVPLTASPKKFLPTHVKAMMNGKLNIIECEQPMTIDRSLLGTFFGTVTQKTMENVIKALNTHFQLKGGRYEK